VAAIRVLADWGWAERPAAIVTMPSRARPRLIASVAEGLSSAGRLPVLGALKQSQGGPSGEPGGNSAYRLAGVWARVVVPQSLASDLADLAEAKPGAPVLLVDDLADSRWTLTIAARELRRAGAAGVLPFTVGIVR